MTIEISQSAATIITILEQNGHQAFVVGGCVRDCMMGTEPHDWDICTSALPEQTIQCFQGFRLIETGLQHGTVTIMMNHESFEVTTFRMDGNYSDNRHPDQVKFVTTLKDDLSRRDFTINAIAYSPSTGIVDYYDGISDINKKIIQCVGNPDERFQEDALRMMRAFRFSSVLGFTISPSVKLGIEHNKELLNNISPERINTELCKLLMGENSKSILTNYVNVLSLIIPEIAPMVGFQQNSPYHHLDVWEHTVQTVLNAPKDLVVKISMLLHDIAKPLCYTEDAQGFGHFYGHPQQSADLAVEILKKLRFDHHTIMQVKELILYHNTTIEPNSKLLKRQLNKLGEKRLRQLIQVKRADIMGQSSEIMDKRLEQLISVEHCINCIIEQQQCFGLKDLAVNGCDLMALGVPKGVQIGEALNHLLNLVMDEQAENKKQTLLEIAKKRN